MSKKIFVVGGVISGIGKGISAASLALLMKMRGCKVECMKFDPYLNSSASCLSPKEHGEVFILDDGSETDLDLGSYERITSCVLTSDNIYTSGRLYKELISEEESGAYLGKTVQIVPDFTNKIIEKLRVLEARSEIVVVEIGGTVGDIESEPFLEAISKLKIKEPDDVLVLLVAPVLWVPTIKEFKTKPLQQSIRSLQKFGLTPDILCCRTEKAIPEHIIQKISNISGINLESIVTTPDVKSIYQVPIEFYNRHVDDLVADRFHLRRNGCRIHKYREAVEKYTQSESLPHVKIGIVGKYENCDEAYISLKEAIYHAGLANDTKVDIKWISAEFLEEIKSFKRLWSNFEDIHGMIVPGGFDVRGAEGKIKAIQQAREKGIPFLGICLGLQCAVVEFARNVCGIEGANSEEFNKDTPHKVIHFIEGQEIIKRKSGTMRLGAYDCILAKDTLVLDLYRRRNVSERHRHRYEVNNEYLEAYGEKGFIVSGINPEANLVEMMELDRKIHPFFVGTQAHPEFKSRLNAPAPLFDGLIKAAIQKKSVSI